MFNDPKNDQDALTSYKENRYKNVSRYRDKKLAQKRQKYRLKCREGFEAPSDSEN